MVAPLMWRACALLLAAALASVPLRAQGAPPASAPAATVQERAAVSAERGLQAFASEDWGAAAGHFGAALDAGHPAQAALWFAGGHCAYRLGDAPAALAAWHRAGVLGAAPQAVARAVALGERRAGLPPGGSLAPPPAREGLRALLYGAALLLECLGVGLLLGRTRGLRVAGLLLALGGLLLGVPVTARLSAPDAPAVVRAAGQVLRAEPHAAAAGIAPLSAGEGVAVLAASDRWAQVRTRAGEGWVPAPAIQRLLPEPRE